MSAGISWWIIVLTVGNTLGMWWLIWWASKPKAGEAASGEVTGHVWDDDLQELNNPMPRWWLWLFYLTIIFTGIYLLLYPGLGAFKGVLGYSDTGAYQLEMDRAEDTYGPVFAAYAKRDIPDLATDRDAMEIGGRLFGNYCAQCHGSDAGGARGFPNLTDGDWQWGGEPAAIETSILDGRQAAMLAWGPILGDEGVEQVNHYVLTLSGRDADAALAEAGKPLFETNCAACHGADGKGNPMLGAPNLTDEIWLYGGSPKAILKSVMDGRQGHMPAHRNFLGEDKVHILAAYVYSLGQKP